VFSKPLRYPLLCLGEKLGLLAPSFEDRRFLWEDPVTRFIPLVRTALLGTLLIAACQPPPPPTESVTREAIQSQLPNRPYSRAVRVGNTFYFSGALGVTEETLAMEEGRVEAETRNVMEAFKALFQEVGV